MSNRTQRLAEFEAIIAALNASNPGEDGNTAFMRLTRLTQDDATDLADQIIINSLTANGVSVVAGSGNFMGALGTVELGHRLGLEEAARLPVIGAVPPPEPAPKRRRSPRRWWLP